MDFFRVAVKELRNGTLEVYPNFRVSPSKDLMVRGGDFYAIWDEEAGLWSTDEFDVIRLVDDILFAHAEKLRAEGSKVVVKEMDSHDSKTWSTFLRYVDQRPDNYVTLDTHLTFANTEPKKENHSSKRLSYSLEDGDYSAWDELVGTLYSVEEREKIEWAIGALVAGDAKKIQKFMVFYGPAGTGKSTILEIIEQLFRGYTTWFEAKSLASYSNQFATEVFKDNPLVGVQHDGDLSKIEDNTKLNSIVSHETMTINQKFKSPYSDRLNAFLFMGTNQPVKITDAKSGVIRRLIDVHPTGALLPIKRYMTLRSKIGLQLGAVAKYCYDVYLSMGMNYYSDYRPVQMMYQTDVFFNFVEAHYDIFSRQNQTTLDQAYALYKEFCVDTGIQHMRPKYKLREDLSDYFETFKDRYRVDDQTVVRNAYFGFIADKFKSMTKDNGHAFSLVVEETESIFDEVFADAPAQYAKDDGTPETYWDKVTTKLRDLDTSKLHYVQVPENHIVIDFDLKDDNGRKSLERNLRAASGWPATYAELSKSGRGIHLHYNYNGARAEIERLSHDYSHGIEVKTFRGNASLRRALTKCNSVPVGDAPEDLPRKERPVRTADTIQSEKGLRDLIARNLRKEIHPGTKPSVDFIHKILDDAYASGMEYDLTDMRSTIMAFANNSTNQSQTCLRTVQEMKFQSENVDISEPAEDDSPLVFYDVEVFPNLLVVCWKYEGSDEVVRMINPTPEEIPGLFNMKLVGFNNRRYDNHILYGRYMGYDNEQVAKLSQGIIDNNRNVMFGAAYGLSYADIYDFSSKKQSLKKFEIELGLHHLELDIPWDEPVPEELWPKVVEYCVNDVISTEETFLARRGDFVARQILAELSGLTVNDTTARHTAQIIFDGDKNPQDSFVYTDLSEEFPGYEFDLGKSSYRDEDPGEGGYVYSEPGIYEDVALLDVESMHPTSIEELNLFGKYTKNYSELKAARMAIKHEEWDKAREMLDGRLAPYLEDEENAEALSYALKIVINIVYGLTSAGFPNPFKDNRNIDNIVAKRGALFMIDLKHFIQEKGYRVIHIKTDSVKIPDCSPYLVEEIQEFGKKYGYDFELEALYDKLCLVNDAVYIARKAECLTDCWTAVGAQFQHPYVFKTLFSGEDVQFEDLCEARSVTKGRMYLDFESVQTPAALTEGHMQHIGRSGLFVPVTEESGGGVLQRVNEDKSYAVAGTKGYLWMEATMAEDNPDVEIDMSYFYEIEAKARETIEKFGDVEDFIGQNNKG